MGQAKDQYTQLESDRLNQEEKHRKDLTPESRIINNEPIIKHSHKWKTKRVRD